MSDDIDYVGMKVLKWTFLTFILVGLMSGLFWIGHVLFYPVDQAQQVVERTLNADNMIYNYEWFHARYADYQSAQTQLQQKQSELDQFMSTAGERTTWNIATQREESQLRIELSGLRAHVANIANEYNSHVGMANRNLFRTNSLPEHLSDH